jgi:hypothetical protein
MKKHFYTHLIEIKPIEHVLNKGLSHKHEVDELIHIALNTIHHQVIEVILDELSDDKDKEIFLTLIETDDHDKIWVFLIEKITNIENKVAIAIKKFGTELELDICDFIEIKK